jgi:tRNA pseudouridine synthase 10
LLEDGICDSCLGRFFSKLGNEKLKEKGFWIRKAKEALENRKFTEECLLCGGVFNRMETYEEMAKEVIKNYEFETFAVGCRVDGLIGAMEELVFETHGSEWAETFKSHFNREIIAKIEKFGKRFDPANPDVLLIFDPEREKMDLQVRPLYVYGRYRKLVRGIPQTKWPCRECRGKGCERCNFSGKMYSESVEELITPFFLQEAKGIEAKFHGSGREDIDARMLGNGRPFVVEIRNPRKRHLELKSIEREINTQNHGKIEVLDLKFVSKSAVEILKSAAFVKVYGVKIRLEKKVNPEALHDAVKDLSGIVISQRTPKRVSHRRADKIRKRKVYQIDIKSIDDCEVELVIVSESGLYIKELMTGDEGRTRPSLAEKLGVEISVEELDVLEVKGGI